jgi:hypothetical protein
MSTNHTIGGTARVFASELRGKTLAEIAEILDAHAAAGTCTRAASNLGGKPMIRYLYGDSTLVRLQPEGSSLTPDPIYIIEVTKRPGVCATLEDVAFKVDAEARATPKGPADLKIPPMFMMHANPLQYAAYRDVALAYGYHSPRRTRGE